MRSALDKDWNMRHMLRIVAAAATLGLLGTAGAWAAPARIVGTVSAVEAHAVIVSADGKSERVDVDDKTRVSVRTPVPHSVLDNNAYVGVTATPQADGTLLASEVHVFADAQRGVGEGHHPMNGPPGTTMTNATVKAVNVQTKSSMTNATVSAASAGNGARRLTLTYPGGTQTIVVPDDVPVVTTRSGDLASLAIGAHVIVNGERAADGHVAAARISVGANGSVPPV
jgi:hypothetical protein